MLRRNPWLHRPRTRRPARATAGSGTPREACFDPVLRSPSGTPRSSVSKPRSCRCTHRAPAPSGPPSMDRGRRVCAAIGGRRRVGAAARDNEKESCDRRCCSCHGSSSTAHHGYRDAAEPPWTFRPHLLRHHPLAFASDVLRVWGASKQHVGDARGRLHKQQERPGSARRLRLCFGACRSPLLMRFARGCSGCWRTWMRTWVSR